MTGSRFVRSSPISGVAMALIVPVATDHMIVDIAVPRGTGFDPAMH